MSSPSSLAPGDPFPAALRDAPVFDVRGAPRRLGELVAGAAALLIFLRHFGCIACAEQVGRLRPGLAVLRALGVRVVLVGNSTPEHLAAFVAREGIADFDLSAVTDPSRAAYRAAGMERSLWGTWGPGAVLGLVRGLARGYVPRRFAGDVNQQGGALLVDGTGRIAYVHRSARLGDHAPLHDIVDRVLVAAAGRAAET